MKAPNFAYLRATDLPGALAALDSYGTGARILAGGQSLMPALNFRLDVPEVLIDINGVAALTGIEIQGDVIRIGALTRHAELEASAVIAAEAPLLAAAVRHVAHPAIRNRGTIGGSLSLADPAAELPACMVALEAELVLASSAGSRTIGAAAFFRGLFETDRRPNEILVEVRVKRQTPNRRHGFAELSRRHGDFAVVGIACQADVADAKVAALRLVVFGSESFPRVASHAAAAAQGRVLSRALRDDIVAALLEDLDPSDNLQGGAATKRQWAQILAGRVVAQITAA
ncbi:MAG: molybdopterin dehydrogenase [Rhodospirillales bacterium]|nr:molybdopterin dehydrogenase [Rhodospirillales bacterium]